MLHAHTPEQVRAAEAPLLASLPTGTLMQRAAYGLAQHCLIELRDRTGGTYGRRVRLLVGGGDNGADALWAGVRLVARGVRVSAVLARDPRPDALAAFLKAGGTVGGPPASAVDLVVDGLVGIGGHGPLRAAMVDLVRPVRAPVVAVDVPSGVDAATGEVAGEAVRAVRTVCFGTYKTGVLVGDGARHAGRVVLVDIGLVDIGLVDIGLVDIGLAPGEADVEALEDEDVRALLPRPGAPADKYTRGVVGIAAGSSTYTGAAVLATTAAVRSGAGMVRFAGVENSAQLVRAARPEVVVTTVEHGDGEATVGAGRVQAWVLGPGLGTDDGGHAVVAAVLATDVPVLVDADALTVCARDPSLLRRSAPTLLTPHDREFARFRALGPDRVRAARELAAEHGVTVLLKGDATVVADPQGRVRVNRTGSTALATAGTGDVLSGGCGTLLAAGLSALDAGSVGSYLHGLCGQRAAGVGTTHALEVADRWPDVVRALLERA